MNENLIDFHSHILPKADHGSGSIETSLKQLSLLDKYGVKHVVATPHFYPYNTSPEAFLERRSHCTEKLLGAHPGCNVKISLGAEVLVCEGMEGMEGLEKLTVEGTDILLLEMPFQSWSDDIVETVEKISKMPFTVVLAHIDRYPTDNVMKLLDFDVYAQLNAEKLSSFFSRRKLMKYMDSGKVIAIGSDIHGANEKSIKNLVCAYDKIGKENREYIISTCSKLLDNAKIIN